MKTITTQLENTIQEYQAVFNDAKQMSFTATNVGWMNVQNRLHRDAGWTNKGAEQVASLARNYGSFVLRNALALAVTLDIHDGEFAL